MPELDDELQLSKKILSPTIKLLGDLLGEIIVEQNNPGLLELEEKIRNLAKEFRGKKNNLKALEKLHNEIKELDPKNRIVIIKAFSLYFQLVNLAEEDYKIHLNERNIKKRRSTDTIVHAINYAKKKGVKFEELLELFTKLSFKLVWTAHPTEARRLSNMTKLREINRLLETLEKSDNVSLEYKKTKQKIKENITLMWQSDNIREEKVQILDEVRTILFYFRNSVFTVLPEIMIDIILTIEDVYAQSLHAVKLPNFIEFGSWVGGDRDGHPGVTANLTIQTLLIQKRTCLRKYLSSLKELVLELSPSLNNIKITRELKNSLSQDINIFPEFAEKTSRLNRLEPYRRKLDFIRIKIENTLEQVEKRAVEVGLGRTLVGYQTIVSKDNDTAKYFTRSSEFLQELEIIERSLRQNRGEVIANGNLSILIIQVRIFGFHLAPLDVRQHSKNHLAELQEIFELITLPKLSELDFEHKKNLLLKELKNSRPLGIDSFLEKLSEQTQELLTTLKVVKQSITEISPRSIESYIISMSHDEIDIFVLMLLMKETGLLEIRNEIVVKADLDIAPLFETKKDLENAPEVMERLFQDPLYKSLLQCRGNVQEIMIGYSDSTKDVGYLQSNYLLFLVQQSLVTIAEEYAITLRIFHGRGGSISRGGGPTHKSILSQPPGTLFRMKITEQGEVIGSNYSNPKIAYRHLEQIISAMIVRLVQDTKFSLEENPANPSKEFVHHYKEIADISSKTYEGMVKYNPNFLPFYIQYTPLDIIERATIGSRPTRRTSEDVADIANLRAIPWIFSWMQTRLIFPTYFGVGTALQQFSNKNTGTGSGTGLKILKQMYQEWDYFKSLIDNLQMVCLKVDINIASKYLQLIQKNHEQATKVFSEITQEYTRTIEIILKITNSHGLLLDHAPAIQNSILRRNPYIDPLSLIQIELLLLWRKKGRPEDLQPNGLQRALLETINGIAAGLHNTG